MERKKKSMASQVIFIGIMIALSGIMMKINVDKGGWVQAKLGFTMGIKFFIGFFVTTTVLALLAGQIQAFYLSAHQDINALFAGKLGIIRAYGLGIAMPGSVAAGDGLQRAWNDGTMSKAAILTFLIASAMGNWLRVLFQIPILGTYLTILVWTIGIVVSLVISALILVVV